MSHFGTLTYECRTVLADFFAPSTGTYCALSFPMLYVLLTWLGLSLLFSVAFLCAAARRHAGQFDNEDVVTIQPALGNSAEPSSGSSPLAAAASAS